MKKIILMLLIVFLPTFVFGATLSVSPSSQTVTAGSTFTVAIDINTGGSAIDGTDIRYLNYDPTILQVEDANGGVGGVQINAGSLMPLTLANFVDNNTGKIIFSQVTAGGNTYTGSGTLATVTFRAVKSGIANLSFNFISGNTTDSNIASNGTDVLTSVVNGSYTITSGSSSGGGGGGGGSASSGGSSSGGSSGGGSSGGTTSGGSSLGGGGVSSGGGSVIPGPITVPTLPGTVPQCIPTSSTSQINIWAGIGSKGDHVLNLQKFLLERGYTTSSGVTGYFGPVTEQALKRFQSDQGIVSSGTPSTTGYGSLGPSTRARINSLISSSGCVGVSIITSAPSATLPTSVASGSISSNLGIGSKGEQVRLLQQFLVDQGYTKSESITGFFGPITESAVKAFQRTQGIVSSGTPSTTGYGNVGPSTRARINSIIAGGAEASVSNNSTNSSSLQSQIESLQSQLNELLRQLQNI